ncbi:MAG: hypothetical protein WD000_03615 [Thermodesulfobacteriota bacterium]
MECNKVREILYLAPGQGPYSAELIGAREHLKDCSSCAEFFKEEEILKNLIYEKAPRNKAPQSLRQFVLKTTEGMDSISKATGGVLSYVGLTEVIPKLSFALLFLILITTSLVLYNVSFENQSASLASRLVEDHIKNIPGDVQILSSDPVIVEQWFRGKLDFVVNVPKLRDTRFIGGRLCQIEGKRLALLFYEKDGRSLSVFVMDGSIPSLNWKDKNVIENEEAFSKITNEKGCNIIFWREKGIVFALVSDIERRELLEIVSGKTIKKTRN